ncbi:chondroitin sulfate N-acetylgalactosaminyltransferase 2 [Bemisia tabaci]|uniref:chondroitin sulfate N-acetylgalactosaminyltransferase 2 n=1 Tax=Bemisia tabaci TaxID=7038 RepID=UPI003B28CEFD
MQRLVMRLILLAAFLSAASLLILGRCGLQEHEHKSIFNTATAGNPSFYVMKLTTDPVVADPKDMKQEMRRLLTKIRALKMQLLQLNALAQEYGLALSSDLKDPPLDATPDCESLLKSQITQDLPDHIQLSNEFEVSPFNHFTTTRIYPTELGLGKRVVEKPLNEKRRDLLNVIEASLTLLNKNLTSNRYTFNDFQEGIYRTLPSSGTHYEVYFRLKNTTTKNFSYVKVSLLKPFLSVIPLASDLVVQAKGENPKELVHVVLPISNRLKTFQRFMDKFIKIGLRMDRNVLLTIVYFGDPGLRKAESIVTKIISKFNSFNNIRLVAVNETLSRVRAVEVAVEVPWPSLHTNKVLRELDDVLLFVCDADIVFSARFLDRCRWNSEPGARVYYPIVFSLYNPHVIYTLQGKPVPSETDQLVISRDTGFWRDFGFGMSCQYKSDFLRMHEQSDKFLRRGLEDISLYRKYLRSKIKVVRATDPGIFHIWHPKTCSEEEHMSVDQYRGCIRLRALNEASHSQMGFLVYQNEINSTKYSSQFSFARSTNKSPAEDQRLKSKLVALNGTKS